MWRCGVAPRSLLVQPRSREMVQRIEETLPAAGAYDPDAEPAKVYTDDFCRAVTWDLVLNDDDELEECKAVLPLRFIILLLVPTSDILEN